MPSRKYKRSTVIPIALLIYLAIMSAIGYKSYRIGAMSAGEYFGIIAATLVVISLLHFFIKKREKIREERENNLQGPVDGDRK